MSQANNKDFDDVSAVVQKAKQILADFLGTEPNEINDEDSFVEHLHMGPSDISDYFDLLQKNGINFSSADLEKITTVGDLIEYLTTEATF